MTIAKVNIRQKLIWLKLDIRRAIVSAVQLEKVARPLRWDYYKGQFNNLKNKNMDGFFRRFELYCDLITPEAEDLQAKTRLVYVDVKSILSNLS